jgi:N-dimethylarginine dimethylaminohydrolase
VRTDSSVELRIVEPARSDVLVDADRARPAFAVSALQCTEHPVEAACQYQVAWSINPHMAIGSVDFALAAMQHAVFVAALVAAGGDIVPVPFIHGAYDSVFIKDPALLLQRRGTKQALLAQLRHPERQRERLQRRRYYAQLGYETIGEDLGPSWEGGDVVMLPSGTGMLLGHGFRTQREASTWLERHAGIPVWPLELRDPRFYHLDTGLTVLPDGTALVCPTALSPASLRTLEDVPGIRRVILVKREDALAFGLNIVAVGDTLVLGAHAPSVEALIRELGFRCLVVPLGQFHLAGGSAACLVAAIHRDPFATG